MTDWNAIGQELSTLAPFVLMAVLLIRLAILFGSTSVYVRGQQSWFLSFVFAATLFGNAAWFAWVGLVVEPAFAYQKEIFLSFAFGELALCLMNIYGLIPDFGHEFKLALKKIRS
jgi:hypothetical protein